MKLKKLLFITLLNTSTLFSVEPIPFENNFCDNPSLNIPTLECQALETFWNSTNGENWTDDTGWGIDTDVSTWFGIEISNGYVSSLLIARNNLTGSIPSTIVDLHYLTRLEINTNNLVSTEIPKFIFDMKTLTILGLIGINLKGDIPEELGNLTNLTILSFEDNNLTGPIPQPFSNLVNLDFCYLNNNQLTGKLPDLTPLQKIRDLRLFDNNFTFSDLEDNVEWFFEREITHGPSYSPQATIEKNQTIYFKVQVIFLSVANWIYSCSCA